MNRPKILVTAAAGNTGFPTAMQLRERGFPVRALVRRQSERSRALDALGAELIIGDMLDQQDLARALAGVQRAYFCPPWSSQMLLAGVAFAVAASAARLESVVVMGQWLSSPDHPSFATRQTWLLDQLLPLMPNLAVTIVNPGWFADNYMPLLPIIAQLGILPLPLGTGLNAPPSNEDMARVIAGALANPETHAGRSYRPTGPRLLTPVELATAFAVVLNRPVRYVNIPDWMMLKALRVIGLPAFQQAQVRYYVKDYRRNAFGIGAPTEDVLEVGGRQPEDFETIVRRYVSMRPDVRRTVINRLKAATTFARIPFTPAFDLDRLQRIQEQPQPRESSLAPDSAAWLATHGGPEQLAVSARLPSLSNASLRT